MSDLITDAMVEAAARAYHEAAPEAVAGSWDVSTPRIHERGRVRARAALEAVAPQIAATAPADRPTVTDDATQRLARAAFAVDSKHHFHEGQDGRPTCSCGFVGDARKRTQTEHITAAVIEEYDHD